MHIVCPHCNTSYAVNPASFGTTGRTVRCARCKETWLAAPEDTAVMAARIPAMADAEDAPAWNTAAPPERDETPSVESPPLASEMPETAEPGDWPSAARHDDIAEDPAPTPSARPLRLRRLFKLPSLSLQLPRPSINLTAVTTVMAALVVALIFWRVDVVRWLPQTATFYQLVGLNVNLRGLAFKDVKLSTETVDGKPVLVIEGTIVTQGRKPVELPRLRFSVRDAANSEIYAWNAVLEQPVLKPGEKAWFRSRLASPPAEGRSVDVRFFNRHDVVTGSGA
jgi:predicted Zn finger-like uncharacterized protein